LASGFLRRALNLKSRGAKFSFKFKIADLKMAKFTKFTSQLKRNYNLKIDIFKKYAGISPVYLNN